MTVYLVVDTELTNRDLYESCKAKARPLAGTCGGEFVLEGLS